MAQIRKRRPAHSKFFKAGWTDERRAKQSEAIQRWKPWEHSTGPKTEYGKSFQSLGHLECGFCQAIRARETTRVPNCNSVA